MINTFEYKMIELIKQWNLWWTTGEVKENRKKILREEIIAELLPLLDQREILVISGIRRCGKSTILYQLIDALLNKKVPPQNIFYFNFDNHFKDSIDEAFQSFLQLNNPQGRLYLFFDEIQNVPDWERWIKTNYDLYDRDVKFIITGSNNSMLNSNLSTLLTGRTFTKNVYPLSFKEYLNFMNFELKDLDLQKNAMIHHLTNYFEKGGFPEVVVNMDEDTNQMRLKEYYNSIILRDIVEPNKVREVSKLIDLVNFCMTNISNLFSYNKISKLLGLNINSLREFLSYVETAYLVYQLKFFSYSVKESIILNKPRKIYCIDSGMRNNIVMRFSKDEGRIAENIVFIELKRRNKEIYYWKDRNEVDFIVYDKSISAINVCYSNNIDNREVKGLEQFKDKRCKEKIIITKNIEKIENGIKYIPMWKWLVGEN